MSSVEPSFFVCFCMFYKPAKSKITSRNFPEVMAENAHADTLGERGKHENRIFEFLAQNLIKSV